LEFGGYGRVEHFRTSENWRGGVQMFMPPMVGYGYFLESLTEISVGV